MSSASSGKPGGPASDTFAPAPQPTVNCPKCGSQVRQVARFCPRCHATLRFQCPSCAHEQRHGGTCDKCGIDFLKYIGAVVAAKQAEADVLHEKLERRSTLLKNILWTPFTFGIPMLRSFFVKQDREKK